MYVTGPREGLCSMHIGWFEVVIFSEKHLIVAINILAWKAHEAIYLVNALFSY